jgi:hypothetical protein
VLSWGNLETHHSNYPSIDTFTNFKPVTTETSQSSSPDNGQIAPTWFLQISFNCAVVIVGTLEARAPDKSMSQRETEQAVLSLPAQAQLKTTAAHELEQAAHELSCNSSNEPNRSEQCEPHIHPQLARYRSIVGRMFGAMKSWHVLNKPRFVQNNTKEWKESSRSLQY